MEWSSKVSSTMLMVRQIADPKISGERVNLGEGIFVPLSDLEKMEHSINSLLMLHEQALESLEFARLTNIALINEFKKRDINPFEEAN